MQTLETFEKALKENYLPVWNNLLKIEPTPLLGKIKKVTLKSNKIVGGAPYGLSGGFGFGAEGKATPVSGGVPFERFEIEAKDMYVNICISHKATQLTGTSGAMARGLDTEVKGGYETAKWNTGRVLYMNGEGVLTTFSALSTAGNTLTVNSVKYLKEGLIVDIYATDGTTPQANGKARRIKSIDRAKKKITLTGESSTFAAGFITVQNSYKREITGLGAIYDDNIKTLYGVSKEENPIIKPVVKDSDGSIDDGVITSALRESKNEKNGNVNMLLASDSAYDAYVNYLRTNNIRVEESTYEIAGGFKAIKFVFGNRIVDIVNESMVADGEIWGVDTSSLELHMNDWKFATVNGSSIFTLMENESLYRALLANYGDLICSNPGSCVRIVNCA